MRKIWNYVQPEQVKHRGATVLELIQRGDTNFSGAYLRGIDLSKIALPRANFTGADLFKARLSDCDLRGANFEQANLGLALVENSNLSGAVLAQACLDSASFNGSDLRNCDLHGTELYWTDFVRANLRRAILTECRLRDVNLASAVLVEATMMRTRYQRCNLAHANFQKADLFEAELHSCILASTDFSHCRISQAYISDTDLSKAIGLNKLSHIGPSSIGIEVLFESRGCIPAAFLIGCGVPNILVEYMGSLTASVIDFQSCFISYSSADESFAHRIYADLVGSGIRSWLFAEDANWGERVWSEIDRSIRLHDRVVLICSEASLKSEPVLRELERALQREDREHRDILFPIRIDDYIFSSWDHPRKADVVAKVVGDFSGWRDPGHYRQSLTKLVGSLSKSKSIASSKN
jgi:uncharacterized protein YjbI with pentapeptide repeats